jgi:hypothetical protein
LLSFKCFNIYNEASKNYKLMIIILSDKFLCIVYIMSGGSSAQRLGHGLDDRGSRVRFLAGAGNFSLHHRVQTDPGAHSASYPMGTRVSFPGDKAAGV